MRVSFLHRSQVAVVFLTVAFAACQPRNDLDAVAARFPAGSPRGVVEALATIDPPRSAAHPESLERAARFIAAQLTAAGLKPELQPFRVGSNQYFNVSALVGSGNRKRIVVGAHYDVYGENPGADDNASGIAALLQIASKVASQSLPLDVELVAFALEEPPYFGSENMGSVHHARALARSGTQVAVMFSLEMLGYYSDEPGSQKYPQPHLANYFSTTGNYIAVLGLSDDAQLLEQIRKAMSAATDLKAFTLSGPPDFPGISQSDHFNYWRQGFPAVLVTDTANFRNPHYHQDSDKPETLDYVRLQKAADAVHAAVVDVAQRPAEPKPTQTPVR
jgi:Zn-dependent M28 family amino/carboxypeptidase